MTKRFLLQLLTFMFYKNQTVIECFVMLFRILQKKKKTYFLMS